MAVEFKDFLKMKWYYQVLITAGVCGALLGLVWYQFLSPIQDDVAGRTKQVQDLQKTIATTMQQQKQLEKIKKDAIDLQAQLDMLKMILPQEKETDQIFRNVQQIAMLSGLSVSRVAPRAQPIDHEIYLEYPTDLDISGKYHNVGVFLDRIRQLPRIVSISGLRISGRGAQSDAAVTTVGASFTATTYVYKEETIASTAPPAKAVK